MSIYQNNTTMNIERSPTFEMPPLVRHKPIPLFIPKSSALQTTKTNPAYLYTHHTPHSGLPNATLTAVKSP